jgi:hypothetical protein
MKEGIRRNIWADYLFGCFDMGGLFIWMFGDNAKKGHLLPSYSQIATT